MKAPVQEAVAAGHRLLGGTLATMAGGAVGAEQADLRHPGRFTYQYGDVDFFHPSAEALSANVQHLLSQGAVPLDDEESRKLKRWMRYGMGGFDTNSLRMETLDGHEFNLVYKLIDRHPLRTAVEQVGSFDFSNLGGSYDMETGQFYDLADYFWLGQDKDVARLFPDRERQWSNGSIGKHQGLRQAGRYATNVDRGYDLQTRCKQPLVQGYRIVGTHYLGKDDDELQFYGQTYLKLAHCIENDEIDVLLDAYKLLNPYSKVQSLFVALP